MPRDILRSCDLARLIHRQREPVLGEILSLVNLVVTGHDPLDHILLRVEHDLFLRNFG